MSDFLEKDKHQQQILFDELETENSKEHKELTTQPILFDNQDWVAESESDIEQDDFELVNNKPNWLWRILLSLLFIVVMVESFEFFTIGFSESPMVTSLYAAILGCLIVLGGTSLVREFSGLRQFKQQQKVQSQVADIIEQNLSEGALDICNNITDKLPCDVVVEKEQEWNDIAHANYSDKELLQLYSRKVLTEVDQKAMAEVAKFSTESVVLVALSPVAIIDMFIMLWRNLRLIDKVAGLYGLQLGYWSRIRLVRQVFVNMVYAGASELIADFGTELIGADLLGKLSGRLAQGLGAGMLTARLGIKTIKLCRPIPFEEDAPKLGHVRKEILTKVKQLMVK